MTCSQHSEEIEKNMKKYIKKNYMVEIILTVLVLTQTACSNGKFQSMTMKDYQKDYQKRETMYQEGYYSAPGDGQYDEINFTFSN